MWRRILAIKIAIVAASLLPGGCTSLELPPESSGAGGGAFQVAIVLPSAPDDGGWSEAGYEGLQLIEQKLGAQVAYSQMGKLSPQEVEQQFRDYAAAGFDFIIGHGAQFEAPAEAVAKEFPRTKFAIMAAYAGNNKNLGALGFSTGELGYLLGAIAALKSETQKVTMIGGKPIPDAVDVGKLFERGAKAIDPNVQVSIEWVNSWSDPTRAKQIARESLAEGTDVIFALADGGNPAIFEAIAAAGVYGMGWPQDQYEMAPDSIITSGIQQVPVVLLEAAILVRQGRWEGKQYRFGLEQSAHYIAPFRAMLTPEEVERVNSIKRDILIHKIDTSP